MSIAKLLRNELIEQEDPLELMSLTKEIPNFLANFAEGQTNENLCWAAVVVTVLRCNGVNGLVQCDLAEKLIAGCSKAKCGTNACDLTGSLGEAFRAALTLRGVSNLTIHEATGAPDQSVIEPLIGKGSPVACVVLKHAMAIYGSDANEVLLFDPQAPGASVRKSAFFIKSFCSNFCDLQEV